MKSIKLTNEAGETAELSLADYQTHIIKDMALSGFTHSESGETTAEKVVAHIVKALVQGRDIDHEIAGEYPGVITRVTNDIESAKGSKEDKAKAAAEAKAAKEAEKAAAEKAAAESAALTLKSQETFATNVAAGADLAAQEFASDVEAFKKALPEGVNVTQAGSGYGIALVEGTTVETVGSTLGYLFQKADNTTAFANQLQFFTGDLVIQMVESKVFPTAKEAAKFISEFLGKSGKTLSIGSLENYKRMAERTPVALRNAQADPTAYLAISAVKAPRQSEGEKDEAFQSRLGAYEKDREAIQEKVAKGEYLKRKDVLDPVRELEYKHGIKERPSSEGAGPSVADYLKQFFHATFGLENLLGAQGKEHKDEALYLAGEETVALTKEDLTALRDEALANLSNALYSNKKAEVTPQDYQRGHKIKVTKVEVGKGEDGKAITQDDKVKVPVYPPAFFEVPAKEEEAA